MTVHVLRTAGTVLVVLSALHLCAALAIAAAIAWFKGKSRVTSSYRAEA